MENEDSPPKTKTKWVAIGIGLKNKLQQNSFDFVKFTNDECDHGCYLITSSGFSFAYGNPKQNQTLQYIFGHKPEEVIRMELNLD